MDQIPTIIVLYKLNQHLQDAVGAIDSNQLKKCRDFCIKCVTILEILQSEQEGKYKKETLCASTMLETIIQRIPHQEDCCKPSSYLLIENFECGTSSQFVEEKTPENPNLDKLLALQQPPQIDFSDIIGCEQVKQSLTENIVVPFNLTTTQRNEIYRGIRCNARNVLLYGPPGTGKTLLANVIGNIIDKLCGFNCRLTFYRLPRMKVVRNCFVFDLPISLANFKEKANGS